MHLDLLLSVIFGAVIVLIVIISVILLLHPPKICKKCGRRRAFVLIRDDISISRTAEGLLIIDRGFVRIKCFKCKHESDEFLFREHKFLEKDKKINP